MPVNRPISIYADTSKGAMFFEGSTVDPRFLGTIVASIHPTEGTTRIVIQRTDKVEADGVTHRKLFRRLHVRRITNEAGVYLNDTVAEGGLGFSVSEVVDYINTEANKTGGSTQDVLFPKLDVIDFIRDEGNTSILMSNGDHYGVNAIRAIEGDDGLCKIVPARADTPVLYSLAFDCAEVNGTAQTNLSNCVNSLNALFTMSALGGTIPSPTYTVGDGVESTWTAIDTIDPVDPSEIYGNGNSGTLYHGPRIYTTETINEPGEYFTFEATNAVAGGGPLFGIGLYSVI